MTMADLLNGIDGIGASEERVLLMATNHPEALDAAWMRGGRVDRKFYIDYARDEELESFHVRIAVLALAGVPGPRCWSGPRFPTLRRLLPEGES